MRRSDKPRVEIRDQTQLGDIVEGIIEACLNVIEGLYDGLDGFVLVKMVDYEVVESIDIVHVLFISSFVLFYLQASPDQLINNLILNHLDSCLMMCQHKQEPI